jgi:hypothetical protein
MRGWLPLGLAVGLAACDPVHDDAVAALGGETPGVRPGPLHRPGQPCLLCHDGAFGDPPAFSVAGTIFEAPSDHAPVDGADVHLTDSSGSLSRDFTTNAAGNFYVPADDWAPVFPLAVAVKPQEGPDVFMHTLANDGSCATCHADPPGSDSPGHVSIRLDDGGTPL